MHRFDFFSSLEPKNALEQQFRIKEHKHDHQMQNEYDFFKVFYLRAKYSQIRQYLDYK